MPGDPGERPASPGAAEQPPRPGRPDEGIADGSSPAPQGPAFAPPAGDPSDDPDEQPTTRTPVQREPAGWGETTPSPWGRGVPRDDAPADQADQAGEPGGPDRTREFAAGEGPGAGDPSDSDGSDSSDDSDGEGSAPQR